MRGRCTTVAVINFRSIEGAPERNLPRMCEYTETAARQGAQIILFPELALCGQGGGSGRCPQIQAAEAIPGPSSARMAEVAKRLAVYVIFGMPVRRKGFYYNSLVAFGPEGLLGVYDKLHLTHLDRSWAAPGEALPLLLDTPYGRLLVSTGFETLYFPEICRYGKAMEANLLLNAAAWTEQEMAPAWQRMLERLCGCNTIPIATANLAGPGCMGGSHILSPAEPVEQICVLTGHTLAEGERTLPGMYLAAVDLSVDRLMPHYPYFEHNYKVGTPDWRPDVYERMTSEILKNKPDGKDVLS